MRFDPTRTRAWFSRSFAGRGTTIRVPELGHFIRRERAGGDSDVQGRSES